MKCYYCGKETYHAERFKNLKRLTCGGRVCTHKFLEDKQKADKLNFEAWKFLYIEMQKRLVTTSQKISATNA